MKRRCRWLNESRGVAIAALAVLCLPILAVTLLFARAVVLAIALAGLMVAAGFYVFSPRFRNWVTSRLEPLLEHKGLRLGTDVLMDRAHSWARPHGREVFVGADDFVQATLGPVDAVDLPAPGTRVRRGDPLFSLHHGTRHVDVRTPLSGIVVDSNPLLRDRPQMLNRDPFGAGWAVRLRGDAIGREREALLHGSPAVHWFRGEVDRLIDVLLAERSPVPGLADGGALVGDLHRDIDDAAWRRLQDSFFTSSDERTSA